MIKRTTGRMILCAVLLAMVLGWIWGNSLMPGEVSGNLSGSFLEFFGKIFPVFSPDNPNSGHIIRKFAHFGEFFALGGLLFWLGGMCFRKTGQAVMLSLGCGIFVAAIDEAIQRFTPGRYGCITDVLLDSSGTITGMIVVLIGYTIFTKRKK